VQTNIVIFELAPGALSPLNLVKALAARGVRLGAIGGRRLRAVTHYGITGEDIDRALFAVQEVLENSAQHRQVSEEN
jgi:threonine aldolase